MVQLTLIQLTIKITDFISLTLKMKLRNSLSYSLKKKIEEKAPGIDHQANELFLITL